VARAAPSTDRLVDLARELAEQWWVVPDVAALAGPATSPGDEEAIRSVAAGAVQPVDPERFDEASQRRLTLQGVRVAVLRSDVQAEAAPSLHGAASLVLTPTPIRTVTIELVPQSGEAQP
jgi:hypothetical protein